MLGWYFVLLVLWLLKSSVASIPPKISGILVPETAVGEEARLMCSLSSGTKPVQFIWTKDGHEVPVQLITNHKTSSTLVIPSVSIQDKGEYTCQAKSSFGEDVKSANLVVSGEFFSLKNGHIC
jgi:hypothetical protein